MRVKEIFLSLQGESSSQGWPTVFVRTAGCDLRCAWCDTTYAYQGGEEMAPGEVAERVRAYGVRRVCLTGGEPLLQPREEIQALLESLGDLEVSIETGGHRPLDLYRLGPRHRWVMDLKTPSSGMEGHVRWENLDLLCSWDEVKLVVADRRDYLWAREVIQRHRLTERFRVIFSPVHGVLPPAELARWILDDRLEVRLQLQLHKLIWGEEARGV